MWVIERLVAQALPFDKSREIIFMACKMRMPALRDAPENHARFLGGLLFSLASSRPCEPAAFAPMLLRRLAVVAAVASVQAQIGEDAFDDLDGLLSPPAANNRVNPDPTSVAQNWVVRDLNGNVSVYGA